jgi:hypothetical protein
MKIGKIEINIKKNYTEKDIKKMREKTHNILRKLVGIEIPYCKVYGINIRTAFKQKVNLWTPFIKGYGNISVTVYDNNSFNAKDVQKEEPIFEYVCMRDDYDGIEDLDEEKVPVLYKLLKRLKRYITFRKVLKAVPYICGVITAFATAGTFIYTVIHQQVTFCLLIGD